ncbi:hypothetical protein D8S78_24120 [Natrialba swarupiae]|nr:hypothetical protein [Natrialba swarupiae]
MTDETPSGSTGVHAENGPGGGDDTETVREFLDEVGVDPTDLESLEELQDVVELDLSADGETVDFDDVDQRTSSMPRDRRTEPGPRVSSPIDPGLPT